MKTSGPTLSLTDLIRAGPNVIVLFTTQLPSITSMCNQSIPASMASSRVSPNLQKSAVRILGVICIFPIKGEGGMVLNTF